MTVLLYNEIVTISSSAFMELPKTFTSILTKIPRSVYNDVSQEGEKYHDEQVFYRVLRFHLQSHNRVPAELRVLSHFTAFAAAFR